MATYGSYVVMQKVSDPDELLRKVVDAFPGIVHQVQASNHVLGMQLNLDTLNFYVHTDVGLGPTLGWKCETKEGETP